MIGLIGDQAREDDPVEFASKRCFLMVARSLGV